jgi:DNA (cytosine-5)-methyltransferase 1
MKHGSLFSGIGGFDLASEWMGWENVFQVEIDKFCTKVLEKNFPNVKRYGDIKEFDGTEYRESVDILSGGFPCQPFSVAGKRKGKTDDRHLWPEYLRVIREVKPSYVVGENVPGIINMELDNIIADLEGEGYTTEQFIIPACALNAPHRRDRLWVVAYHNNAGSRTSRSNINNNRTEEIKEWEYSQSEFNGQTFKHTTGSGLSKRTSKKSREKRLSEQPERLGSITPIPRLLGQEISEEQTAGFEQQNKDNVTNTQCSEQGQDGDCNGFESERTTSLQTKDKGRKGTTILNKGCINISRSNSDTNSDKRSKGRMYETEQQTTERHAGACNARNNECTTWNNFPTVSPLCGRNDGISNRVERLKALGNAVVPQVVYQIFKAIEQYENEID